MPVVVGYVSTPPGEAALTTAITEARLRDLTLVVVLTARDTGPDEPRFSAEQQLDALAARLDAEGVRHDVRHFPDDHDPAGQILAVADDVGAELIVIGQRSRTPVGKLLMGSTGQRVLLDARCAVLAVKAPAR